MKKCEECGERKKNVTKVADPFAEQVNDEVWMRWLCGPCAQNRADEA